jgi:hypothetical protein
MENQYFNLAEKEFSKESKIILWCFSGLFFLTGVFILFRTLVLGNVDISAGLSAAPFGISIVVGIIAAYATIKRTNLYFAITDEKLEFRYGILKPKMRLLKWAEIREIIIPSKQRKVIVIFNDGGFFVINLTWIEKKKSTHIIKHIYHMAREKNVNIKKVKIFIKPRPNTKM